MGRNDLYSEISCTEFPSKGLEFEIHLTRIHFGRLFHLQENSKMPAEQNSNEALPHYQQSPDMIQVKLTMNGIDADSVEKLKAMDIDRRWNCDNRVPTWTFGMVNMGHDFNFLHNGGIVCDTASRSAYYHNAILDGYLSRNEVRELEGYPRVDGLDDYLYPTNMAVVGQEPDNKKDTDNA